MFIKANRVQSRRNLAMLGAALFVMAMGLTHSSTAWAQEEGYVPLSGEFSEKAYFGKKITMDYQEADIKSVLRVLSEVSGMNIITGDEVVGKITIKLQNVPWDQALDVILKTKKLGMVQSGNIIRIAPLQTLQTENTQKLAAEQAALMLEDLILEMVPVSYANASDLVTQVRTVLSSRGVVSVDERTNVIIIRDVAKNLQEAKKLIINLDTQTPQVLIRARIVEATTDFTRELGVKWGGVYVADAAHGNATGLTFPNSVRVTGANATGESTDANQTQNIGSTSQGSQIPSIPNANYVVNLPAPIGPGAGGGVGITLGSINDVVTLDLQLSAMENRGEGRVISQPEIMTLDNKEASITQGTSIPFQIRQQGETSLSFIEANLNLTVTPHVTNDKSIVMVIKIAKNAPNTAIPTSTGDPAIDKKEAETETLVRNGETTVIGGIFTSEETRSELAVPWLSRIPILGYFFRDRKHVSGRSELLIFITPRIVQDKPVV
ncbi:MAG: type IV pilus secretin PilQ [Deltaproteobacteria bacterium]|nr:type IV pilus secretin PilQ [Deltaproteobacteria bacterium]MCB9478761.1 type IV pilus secretin PilQ [Deltaproteobacteria bacterium]MCB9488277.1 type IV pilus secretin PilQ [Deltaproteobacteria bacterium]